MAKSRVKYLPGNVRYRSGSVASVKPRRVPVDPAPPETTAPKPWHGESCWVKRHVKSGEIDRMLGDDETDGPYVWTERGPDERGWEWIECVLIPAALAIDGNNKGGSGG